jgi:hypothetical protein
MPPIPSPPQSRPVPAAALLIAAVLFVSYAYFYQGTGWNQDSHFALARALVEQRTVRIDQYQNTTGDKAYYQGHYYSDKAPGLSLAALPAVAASAHWARWLHVYPWKIAGFQLYFATLLTCSLAIALAAATLFLVLLGWAMTPGAAIFAVVVFGLGTPMWIYATQFWGHALASACLLFAFAAADSLRRVAGLRTRSGLAGVVGLAAGWAVVSEYPAAIPAVLIGLMALVHSRNSAANKKSFYYPAAALCITAGLCLAVILIYQKVAFGSPLRLGYEYVVNYQETLHQGALGLSYPKLHPLVALLFGKRCGLLLFAPILALAPLGFRLLWRAGLPRLSLGVSAAIAIYYLLFNASYLYWQAGASFGPRYLSPGLPFACLFLAPLWQRATRPLKMALAAIAAYGILVALAGATTTPMISEAVSFPIPVSLGAFTRGRVYHEGGAWNLGVRLGLHGLWTVAPLTGILLIAAMVWWRVSLRCKPLMVSTHPGGRSACSTPGSF